MHGYIIDRFPFLYKVLVVFTINLMSLHSVNSQNIKTGFSSKKEQITTNTNTTNNLLYNDELNFGSQIDFNKKQYELKWGIHPNPIFYKQEYYTKKGGIGSYTEKITIEVILGNYQLNDILTLKINELDSLITVNPILDYEVFEDKKNNQLMIDFITNENAGYYEWNALRYIKREKPQAMIVLFKYTYRRPYVKNKDLLDFLLYAKKIRKGIIHKAYLYEIPKIKIKTKSKTKSNTKTKK